MIAAGETFEFRRALKAALIAVVAVAGSLIFQGRANAEVKTLTIKDRDNEAWFWYSNQSVGACTPLPPPGALCESGNGSSASPISPGHLGVSWKNNSIDMRSYALYDLSFIPPASTVNSMIATFNVSTNDASDTQHTQEHAGQNAKPPATQVVKGTPAIKACLVTQAWGPSEGDPPLKVNPQDPTGQKTPDDPAERSGVDETNCVEGQTNSASTLWSFDLTSFAKGWVSGSIFNWGFDLEPDTSKVAQGDVWTIELHGVYYVSAVSNPTDPNGGTTDQVFVDHKHEATATIDYIPAVATPTPTPTPSQSSSLGGGGSSGGGSSSGPTTGPAPTTAPNPGPTPTQTQSQKTVVPVSQTQPGTPGYVWWMIPPALLAWIGFTRAVGGETAEGVTNRVAAVIRKRRGSRPEDSREG
ncbi:MAG: hypothetical protein ACYDCC_11505 [Actinomycetota bacterium]